MEMLSWASAEESVHMAEGYDKMHEGPRRRLVRMRRDQITIRD